MYDIEIAPFALKSLDRLKRIHKNIADRVVAAIDSLRSDPSKGKKLAGDLSDFRSLRVGEYRILYTVIRKRVLIQIVKTAHRREVYRA